MVYPWNRKKKKEPKAEELETIVEENQSEDNLESEVLNENKETLQEEEKENSDEDGKTSDNNEKNVSDSLILNILKLEGYKMDSGDLFKAFREAGGEMAQFKGELDKLSQTGKIKSDSDGWIMTVENYNVEKSQEKEDKSVPREENDPNKTPTENVEGVKETEVEKVEEKESEIEAVKEETKKSSNETQTEDEDIESIIKLKEETDTWLIEQLKNKGQYQNDNLTNEVKELRERVEKLEKIIINMTKAFE